jgi:hypothetical protein
MASVNAINTKTDLTVQIFDRFYGYEQTVPVAAYDAVLSYFRSVFGSDEAAGNFTVSLFRVSDQTGIPVMTLLQQFQRHPQFQHLVGCECANSKQLLRGTQHQDLKHAKFPSRHLHREKSWQVCGPRHAQIQIRLGNDIHDVPGFK